MITINRPPAAPAVLAKGATLVNAMFQQVTANPGKTGKMGAPFKFDNKIYGDRTVKDALFAAQHDKCAYCEGMLKAFGWGDVEHYRPKTFSQQKKGDARIYPGYFWLAYEWTNLLASCSKCNSLRKKNLFPLHDPSKRATKPADLANERPLIVDPAGPGDPRQHIAFKKNVPEALTQEGEKTIEAIVLDREELNGERLRHMQLIASLVHIVAVGQETDRADWKEKGEEASAALANYMQPHAPFSAMTLCYMGL